jgi:hypothetical protein
MTEHQLLRLRVVLVVTERKFYGGPVTSSVDEPPFKKERRLGVTSTYATSFSQ